MFITVMSLAISLAHPHGFHSLPQQEIGPSQVQQKNKDKTPAAIPLKTPVTGFVKPTELPPGDNAWSVQIVSGGGLVGSGRGDLTVTSDGILTWIGTDGSCKKKLNDEAMQALARVVLAANSTAASAEAPATSLCRDCFSTTLILSRRGVDGVNTITAYWDDASQAQISADIITVYEAVMAYKGCRL